MEELREACHADHGYTLDAPAVQVHPTTCGLWWWGRFGDVAEWLCFGFVVQWLFETLVGLSPAQQRQFLCFATGSPRLPIGGTPATTPPPLTRAVDGQMQPKWFWLRC